MHRSQLASASKHLPHCISEPSFTSTAQSSSPCPKARMVVPVFSTQRSLPQSSRPEVCRRIHYHFQIYLSQRKSTELFWKVTAKVVSLGKVVLPSRNKAKKSGYRLTAAGLNHRKSESTVLVPSWGRLQQQLLAFYWNTMFQIWQQQGGLESFNKI